MSSPAIIITTQRKSIPVEIDGKKGYTLRELSGKGRDEYLALNGKRITYDAKGNSRVGNYDGIQADLLTLSLHDPQGNLVSRDFVNTLPSSAQQSLFDVALEMSKLGKADAAAKAAEESDPKN